MSINVKPSTKLFAKHIKSNIRNEEKIMSFYKTITYTTSIGFDVEYSIGASSTADILATILTVNKVSSWISDNFNLDDLSITYTDDKTILSKDSDEPIVDFTTLKNRFNAIIDDLKKRGIIKNTYMDLWDFIDKNPNAYIYNWDPESLVVVLDFLNAAINIKDETGSVTI